MNLSVKRLAFNAAGAEFAEEAQRVDDVANPLAAYPNRNWEKLYRNQYAYDRAFSWVCAPNDTHNCRITAHVRNGVHLKEHGEHSR